VFKLAATVLVVITVGVLTYYFYERAKELQVAEERAKAVGDRVFESGGTSRAEEGGVRPE
jgi:hypothetical protein